MKLRFLNVSGAALPDLLAAPLGQHGSIVNYQSSMVESITEFDLLVVDCSAIPHHQFETAGQQSFSAIKANRPVLLFRPTQAHKQTLAQYGVIFTYICSDSLCLLIDPTSSADGDPVALVEHMGAISEGMVERTLDVRNNAGQIETVRTDVFPVNKAAVPTISDLQPFISRVQQAVHRRSFGGTHNDVKASNDDQGPNLPPSDIPKTLWNCTPILLYWTLNPHGGTQDNFTPPQGNITLECLASVGVYYDNVNFNQPVQWLLIEHSGHLYTQINVNDKTNRGWSLAYMTIAGQNISSATMVSNQSSPNNVSDVTQYTSSSEFTVGLTAGTEGIAGNMSYSIGSSQSCSISDWKIIQKTPNSWLFDQQTPYDGTTDGFPDGAAGSDGVAALPTISTSALAFNSQTVWVHLPATKDSINVSYTYDVQCRFTWSESTGTDWSAWSWRWHTWPSKGFTIAFSSAYPTK
ncbi:hypothetical protein FGF66_12290 [Chlorobaculum thiosulfatiphilum]|uniref:Uncharacterized protein n=1 Tax=Chlorobaculum thiosulfatiphilum TaxID=115852 RepID=A0A5C4RYA8_CHLTI|nr:hypothetical protein [Chlorobaculum thiosulfatiphilum]TNJ36054.1 hypothetical protein FGF66_12290 [Chlorobaculum thiosulfatiphilum]